MKKQDSYIERLKRAVSGLVEKKSKAPLIAAALAGAALMLLSGYSGPGKAEKAAETPSEDDYNAAYVAALELELERAISGVSGAGETEVYITLERGVRYVYAKEEKLSGDSSQKSEGDYEQRSESESSLVVIDGENGKQPVMLEREEPAVLGAVVICEGAGNSQVAGEIIELTAVLCGIGTNRVKVAPMKSN